MNEKHIDWKTQRPSARNVYDVLVIGGGAIGSTVGYGLARKGASVAVLDGADDALRAVRGNAGLVWFQRKGLGMQPYVQLTLDATKMWRAFSEELQDRTGIDVNYEKTGGIDLYYEEDALSQVERDLATFRLQSSSGTYDCEILDHQQLQSMIPSLRLGERVVAGSFSPHDGQVYPLAMLQALQVAFKSLGGDFFPGHEVKRLEKRGSEYIVETAAETFIAKKVVLAAGLGIPKLAEMLGESVELLPERGQILVTESVGRKFPHTFGDFRQTPAGNLLLGSTNESVGFDDRVTSKGAKNIAQTLAKTFPELRALKIIRMWGALRILTKDRLPIYHESQSNPGLFILTSHSAITLASVNASAIPDWIMGNQHNMGIDAFSMDRFDCPVSELECTGS